MSKPILCIEKREHLETIYVVKILPDCARLELMHLHDGLASLR